MVEDATVLSVDVRRRHLSKRPRPRLGCRHWIFPVVNLLESSQLLLLEILLKHRLRHRNRVHLLHGHWWQRRSLRLLNQNRLDGFHLWHWLNRRSSAFGTLVATIRALRDSIASVVHGNALARVARELVVATLGRRGRSRSAARRRRRQLTQLDAERWDQSRGHLVTTWKYEKGHSYNQLN